jgi:hypothetical protein
LNFGFLYIAVVPDGPVRVRFGLFADIPVIDNLHLNLGFASPQDQ